MQSEKNRKSILAGVVCFMLFISCQLNGQQKHAIFGEFLGAGFIYTLNYDYRFSDDIAGFGLNIGFEYIPSGNINSGFMAIPIQGNLLVGNQPHFFELSAGAIYIGGDASFLGDYSYDRGFGISAGIKYRLQLKNGFLLKFGFITTRTKDFTASAWPGLSLGYAF